MAKGRDLGEGLGPHEGVGGHGRPEMHVVPDQPAGVLCYLFLWIFELFYGTLVSVETVSSS